MEPSSRFLSALQRGYQFLLTAYPKEFRERFGTSMTQVFRDRCREESSRHGTRGLLRLSLHTFFDLLVSAAAEHTDRLAQDVRYGSRALIKSPGFTAMAVLALAFGIGANSAVFNALNAALLPLPYHDPDRLALAWEFAGNVSLVHYADWQKHNRVFEQTALFSWKGVDLTGEERPARLVRSRVSTDFFSLLGVKATIGRTFQPAETLSGKSSVAILSHDLWQRRYHSSPTVIGKRLLLDGESMEVIGVMPTNFRGPVNPFVELWTPLTFETLSLEERRKEQVMVLARLKPGTTSETAKTDLERIVERLDHQVQKRPPADGIQVRPLTWLRQGMSFGGPAVLIILQISVALMLLLACANVSGLLLARATLRQKEMGIRAELGASRSRLIRQLLTESLLLALLGGILGLLLAWGITHLLTTALSTAQGEFASGLLGFRDIGIDGRMLGFTVLVTLLTGLVFGLTPAFVGSKAKQEEFLQPGRWQWRVTFPKQHIHSLLVVIEVAVALVLLTRGALEVQDALSKPEYRQGLNPANVLTMEVHVPGTRYSEKSQVLQVCGNIVQKVQGIPDVKSVGLAGRTPYYEDSAPFLGGSTFVGVAPEGSDLVSRPLARTASYSAVSSTFFSTLRIPLRKGRYFSDEPLQEGAPPAVITERIAQQLFPAGNALGKRIRIVELPDEFKGPQQFNLAMEQQMKRIAEMPGQSYSIVGIAENLWGESLRADIYLPYLQGPQSSIQSLRFMTLVARTTSDAASLADQASKAVWEVDKNLPISKISTLEQTLEEWKAPDRLLRQLLAFFAAASLFLAAVGIYGLTTYVVGQRTREIGVRLSLGARPVEILRSVMVQGAKLILIGVAFGLLLTFTLPIFLTLLYGIVTVNPELFKGDLALQRMTLLVVGLLVGTALILAISGAYSLRQESSPGSPHRTGILQAARRFQRLLGKASKLTLTGVLGGLYFTSALVGFYIFMSDRAHMMHPPAFASGSVVLAMVTLTACYLTARKAIQIDPMEALRSD